MSQECVNHEGRVSKVTDDEITVTIVSRGACGGCSIKSACNMSESTEKTVVVTLKEHDYKVGDKVDVIMAAKQGNMAVLYAYLIPIVLVIVLLLLFSAIGLGEGLTALLSIGILVPYYLVLYTFRDKLKSKFTYNICHKD